MGSHPSSVQEAVVPGRPTGSTSGRPFVPLLVAMAVVGSIVLQAPSAHASPGYSLYDRVLHIDGEWEDDTLVLTCENGHVKVNGGTPPFARPLDCARLVSIAIATRGGADVVDLSGVTAADFPEMVAPSVSTGSGDDTLTASPVGAILNGGSGSDTVLGRRGPDRLAGDAGTDDVRGGRGIDTLEGSYPGAVTLTDGQLVAGNGTDTLASIERASLGVVEATYDGSAFSGPQRIDVRADVTVMSGSADDTLVLAGAYSGSFDGGAGTDTIEIQTSADVDLDPGLATTESANFTLSNIESAAVYWRIDAAAGGIVDARGWVGALRYVNLSGRKVTFLGGHGRDRAMGGSGRDVLEGFDGDDTLRGRSGRDELIGGPGRDVCIGGPGADALRGCEA